MTNQQQSPLGKLLGGIGFFTGLVIGWNGTQNLLAALICGIVVACLGAFIGNVVSRIIIITISIILSVGITMVRMEACKAIRDNASQDQRIERVR